LKTILIFALMLAIVPATSVVAGQPEDGPPANGLYGAGWGMNPTKWNDYSDSWSSGFSMYAPDPGHPAGAGWLVGWAPEVYIQYAPITLELWIEMYMIQTYYYTSYQWHRLGDEAETITFDIKGTVKSNEGCWILCTADPLWNPDQLTFVGNMGAGDDRNARDIPIDWSGRWGHGLVNGTDPRGPGIGPDCWGDLTWVDDELILDEVTACDRWFTFRGVFSLVYHEADGYYYLEIAGCPTPSL